jgi:hypothetical protein
MRKISLLFLTVFFFSTPLLAQRDSCKVGVYINSLTDFNISDKSFTSDFWIWFNYTNDSLIINDAIEIPGSKSVSFGNFSTEKKGDINWAQMLCKATIEKHWDVSSFPFDRQKLEIVLEHSFYDASALKLTPDAANTKINSNLKLNEWIIDSLAFYSSQKTYNTTYGDPVLTGSSTYPAVTAEIYLTRAHSWNTLFKMLTGVYVAFAIILLAFFVKPTDRLGLCVGGIFAVVGNKYIIESIVPSTVSNTLLDNIHNLTFLFIFIVLVMAVVSFKWMEKEEKKYHLRAERLDRIAFLCVLTLYTTCNLVLILNAAG